MRVGPEGLRPAANRVRREPPRAAFPTPNVSPRIVINLVRCVQLDGAESKGVADDGDAAEAHRGGGDHGAEQDSKEWTTPRKSPPTNVTPADSIATLVPVPIAIPTWDAARAGASLMPSPHIATVLPSCLSC